jgi:hypothetical protein
MTTVGPPNVPEAGTHGVELPKKCKGHLSVAAEQDTVDMTDKKPMRTTGHVAEGIPGLGRVHLRGPISIGVVTQAYDFAGEADERERPDLFANFVLANMLVSPSVSIDEIAELRDDAITALVDAAVDVLEIRNEYDSTSTDLPPRERLYCAFDTNMRNLRDVIAGVTTGIGRYAQTVEASVSDLVGATLTAVDRQREMLFDGMLSPLSRILSEYRSRHTFIRCPACGHEYPISDSDLGRQDLFERVQQRQGKGCSVQCDEIIPKELDEKLRQVRIDGRQPRCTHRFTLHEGLVEYKAQAPLAWFSRGPYTLLEEGVADARIGQAVRPELKVPFFQIDYVEIIPRESANASVTVHWRTIGQQRNEFEILTSAEHADDIGKPITLSWRAVGIKRLPRSEDIELWKRYLISSASKLMYEFDARMSILESWMAFELFLDGFIEENWKPPRSKGNLEHLWRVAGHSAVTKTRILLHEALGVHFVGSEVWEDWNWTREFRNQVAHGGRLKETEYRGKCIGRRFGDTREVAKFCYRSVVRAIYFVRYWDAD